jgi:hypothetical protein
MTREALLGSDQRYFLLQRTRDVTQLHILARLDAEQHLRYEPRCRLRQTRTQFGGELRQLRFESGPDFGIVHRDASWWLGFSGKKPFYHGSRPLPLSNPGKLLIFRRLGYGPFRFWGNS